MAKADKNEVAEKSNTALATMPDYLKREGPARGSEEVGADDIQIPRIEVAQALSPQINESKPEYIPGLKQGMLYNTLTGEILRMPLPFIPIYFRKRFLAWKDRKKGGGLRGIFETLQEAEDAVLVLEDKADITIQETAEHFVIYGYETGGAIEAVISMPRTKLKISRKLNSLVRLNAGDRFSRQYLLQTGEEQNSANQDYWNIGVVNNTENPWAPEEAFKYAERTYDSIVKGQRVVNTSYAGADAPDSNGSSTDGTADDTEL